MRGFDLEIQISDKISFVFIEYGRVEQDGHSLCVVRDEGVLQIPVGNTAVLMLMPGTSITHAAIQICAREGCLVLWVGEYGVRCYCAGNPLRDGSALLRQSAAFLSDNMRLRTARRMYQLMFDEEAPAGRSVDQLRGIEGSKVREIYKNLACQHDVRWVGRCSTGSQDSLNQCISYANASLYGITEAAILALGYAPSIGFIHTGDPRSFVFDIADIFKFKSVVPLAFSLCRTIEKDIPGNIRRSCRDLFKRDKTIVKIVNTIQDII